MSENIKILATMELLFFNEHRTGNDLLVLSLLGVGNKLTKSKLRWKYFNKEYVIWKLCINKIELYRCTVFIIIFQLEKFRL